MAKQHGKQFKLDAVQYFKVHKDLCVTWLCRKPESDILSTYQAVERLIGIESVSMLPKSKESN